MRNYAIIDCSRDTAIWKRRWITNDLKLSTLHAAADIMIRSKINYLMDLIVNQRVIYFQVSSESWTFFRVVQMPNDVKHHSQMMGLYHFGYLDSLSHGKNILLINHATSSFI